MVLQSEFRLKASFYSDKLTGVSKEIQNSLKRLLLQHDLKTYIFPGKYEFQGGDMSFFHHDQV